MLRYQALMFLNIVFNLIDLFFNLLNLILKSRWMDRTCTSIRVVLWVLLYVMLPSCKRSKVFTEVHCVACVEENEELIV